MGAKEFHRRLDRVAISRQIQHAEVSELVHDDPRWPEAEKAAKERNVILIAADAAGL